MIIVGSKASGFPYDTNEEIKWLGALRKKQHTHTALSLIPLLFHEIRHHIRNWKQALSSSLASFKELAYSQDNIIVQVERNKRQYMTGKDATHHSSLNIGLF